jgi:hypothetical protein
LEPPPLLPEELAPPELAVPLAPAAPPELPDDDERTEPPEDDDEPLPPAAPDEEELAGGELLPPSAPELPCPESPHATQNTMQAADTAHALRFVILVSFSRQRSSRAFLRPRSREILVNE